MKFNFTKFLIIAAFLLVGMDSLAQITIHAKEVEIQTVFKSIEHQSKFTFLYDTQDLKGLRKVTVNVENGSIQDALNQVFKNLQLSYKIIAQTILVKKIQQNPTKGGDGNIVPTSSSLVLRGIVLDENKQPLKNVEIQEMSKKSVVYSNQKGEFKLSGEAQGSIAFSLAGFTEKIVAYTDTSFLLVSMEKSKKSIDLSEVQIVSSDVKQKPTQFINLNNRNYMNLSQVLQGTIPGLSLQIVNTSTKTITSIDAFVYRYNGVYYNTVKRFTVEEFLNYFGQAKGQNIIDILLKGTNVPTSISNFYKLNTVTTVTNTLVPEIRGANNFGSNISSMLVVIDGFPQDGFPANYPMTNVESIEVVKDPAELTKWGARASGGVILIRSKAARPGKLQFNYNSSFYYAAAPKINREQLRLANSEVLLNYLNDIDTTLKLSSGYSNAIFGLSPAKQLLSKRYQRKLSDTQFNAAWDSLSRLNNESQLDLLRQSSFNQTQNLTVSGGTQAYKFTAIGNYTDGRGNDLGNRDRSYGISLNSTFNLFKNKLNIRWLINYNHAKMQSGYSFLPTNASIDPYQMLLDQHGSYLYDYTMLSADANSLIESRGYKNYGVNLLQDARVNKNTNTNSSKQSNLNMNWNLLPGLNWTTSFLYNDRNNSYRNLYGAESSYVRQQVNTYGQLTTNGVIFYAPYGDMLNAYQTESNDWNLRSGLVYARQLGKHRISVGAGAGAASLSLNSPSYGTLYGYNSNTNTSTPVYLPTSPSAQSPINNFYALFSGSSATVYPYLLTQLKTGDTSKVRNVNANLSLGYDFSDRIRATGLFMEAFSPLYGQSSIYSTQTSYNADVTGKVVKNWGGIIKDVLLSVGTQSIKMPDIPEQYSNVRYIQNLYKNYTIWVNGATPTQQQGQSSRNIYQKITLAFKDSVVVVNGAYNTQKVRGSLITLNANNASTDSVKTLGYLSAGIDLFLRRRLLLLSAAYAKSPEGADQFNGRFSYDIGKESYFESNTISDLRLGAVLQQISPYQGLGLMQSTNVASNGSFSQATNTDFGLLPAQRDLFEINARMGLSENRFNVDLRYYNQTSGGLTNNLSVLTDPSTGLSTQTSYSNITNKGLEFYFNTLVAKTNKFNYSVTLNGAHNTNIAKSVPLTRFTATRDYTVALRDGYDISNVWGPRWAGLNGSGDPQIYDKDGKVTAVIDSATVASSLINLGVAKAPWTGGFIQEVRYGHFFARMAITFNFGYVMRYYLPYPGGDSENSSLIAYRWRRTGDEQFTDIPRILPSGVNTYREFVSRYSSNSVLPADNIRLQEVMLGFNLPDKFLKKYGLGSFMMSVQVQNLAYWAKNEYNIDPVTMSQDGRIGMPLPKTFSCNLSVNF